MNYKLLLLSCAAVLLVRQVKAADDFTSPFYLPSESQVLSDTAIEYQRTKFKHDGAKEDFRLEETALIGFGQETAALARIGNNFNFKYLTNETYNNDLNLDYEIGAKTNLRANNGMIMQLGGSYYTFNPRSWYGRSGAAKAKIREMNGGNTRWHKEVRGEAKLGYEIEDGLTPYASLTANGIIDDADRDWYYTAFAGVHKLEYDYSFDAGLQYEFDFDGDKNESWHMQASSDYFLGDEMSLGGYLDYQFISSGAPKIDYGYTLGARFKFLF